MKNRIAVISDIHSNADALTPVLDEIVENEIDLTIFLGDILTYGMQPLKVLKLLSDYSEENTSIFIKGNHDQLYFDIHGGQGKSSYQIPAFVEESFLWTLAHIEGENLAELFDWREDYVVQDIYFSHANPFGYGDWRYLECDNDLAEAHNLLTLKKFRVGVFGHSHRQFISVNRNRDHVSADSNRFVVEEGNSYIVNAGSVGQPRGNGSCYLTLEIDGERVSGELRSFEYNINNTVALISASYFSRETKDKLLSYLRS
jgi:predicted phosphodiesterase